MVNCNPETVSTDYDTLRPPLLRAAVAEEVLAVLDREKPVGVVTQFGGQTPLRLARHIEAGGYRILGTPHRGDRSRRGPGAVRGARRELGVRCPPWATVEGAEEALAAPREIGYPVLVRPSYVLGGRAMRICYGEDDLRAAMAAVSGAGARRPLRRERDRDRRRRALRRDRRLHRRRDAARRGGRRPLRRLVLRAARAVAHARERARGRARRAAARPRARSRRPAQRPARDRRRRRSTCSRRTRAPRAPSRSRQQGDRRQPRRGGLPPGAGERLADLGLPGAPRRPRSASRRPCCRSRASPAPTRCSDRRCARPGR